MGRKHEGAGIYGPLGLLAVLAGAFFVGSLALGAHRIDRAEKVREETLIRGDIPRRVAETANNIKPFFVWDEAMQRLDNQFDFKWAHENIGTLAKSPTFNRVLVVDYADRPIYAATPVHDSVMKDVRVSRATQDAVAEVRAAEARPLPPMSAAVHAVRISMVNGEPMVIIASLVRSDTGVHKPLHGRAPVLVAEARVEVALRKAFSERFLLPDLRVEAVRGTVRPRGASVNIGDTADGRTIRLSWTPERPGLELLSRSSPFLALAALIVLGSAAALVAHARRIAGRLVRSQDEARRLALHDPLTGLANRLLLSDRLNQAREALRRRSGSVAVLCLDLDRFKEVNDTYGHEAGDELIQEVGRRLQAVCRAEDTVARLGGDEFAVVQGGSAGAVGAAALAERVVRTLSGPVQLKAGPAVLSCSVGVAVTADPDLDQLEMLRQADLALYRAKERGRGRYCFFEPEMDQALRTRKTLERDLRAMIADGGPQVHYQPLVRVDGGVFGVEALARWNDPARGAVSPAVFVKLAEECGLIGPLGDRVFRRACEDGLRWPGLRVAVNLSPVQFRQPGFLQRVEATLAETGADPARMDLEITESCLIQDDRLTHDVLADLRRMGFSLALDDFGTGYSSLSYLHRYPVQKLKLDRAFTARLGVAPEARAIVEAVVGMARALDMQVLAEGVETSEQFDMLRDLGCREFQGYLFARPADAASLDALLGQRAISAA